MSTYTVKLTEQGTGKTETFTSGTQEAARVIGIITGNALTTQKILNQKTHTGVYLNPQLKTFKLEVTNK